MALCYCFGSKETHILEEKADDLEQSFKIFAKCKKKKIAKCVTNDKKVQYVIFADMNGKRQKVLLLSLIAFTKALQKKKKRKLPEAVIG